MEDTGARQRTGCEILVNWQRKVLHRLKKLIWDPTVVLESSNSCLLARASIHLKADKVQPLFKEHCC